MKKIYIREGRSFKETTFQDVQSPCNIGQYYNSDGTFTRSRTDLSIGLCINQTFEMYTICSLYDAYASGNSAATIEESMLYAKAMFNGEGRLGTFMEHIIASTKFAGILNIQPQRQYWMKDEDHKNKVFVYYKSFAQRLGENTLDSILNITATIPTLLTSYIYTRPFCDVKVI